MHKDLVERPCCFNYAYRMRCDCCGQLSDLSAKEYFEQSLISAMMTCCHCGEQIHFGPNVLGIRTDDDPALDNTQISRLAWYHTSTWSDWPSASYAEKIVKQVNLMKQDCHSGFEAYLSQQSSKALHLGTYEAAIENMLRRMHDQDDAASKFYLYRVRLAVRPNRINNNYRDENYEPASQLTLFDLDRDNFDAVRYLNVHEAMGSLSLAVRPTAIHSIQMMPLSFPNYSYTVPAALGRELVRLHTTDAELRAEAKKWAQYTAPELQMIKFGLRADPEGIGSCVKKNSERSWQVWKEAENLLSNQFLTDVSSVVVEDFYLAITDWQRKTNATINEFTDRFAHLAYLLTNANDVIHAIASQPVRLMRQVDA